MGITVNSNQWNIISGKNNQEKQSRGSTNYKVGDIVQGTVVKVTDRISIQFNERCADVSKDTLPSAKEGDLLNFRVTGMSSDGSMSLQYISDQVEGSQARATICTAVLSNMTGRQYQLGETSIVDLEKEQEALSDANQRMTKEDYEDLSKEGISLEKYELERFERALERIKSQREIVTKSIDFKVKLVKQEEEDLRKVGLSDIADPALKVFVATMLESMNLPASNTNIAAVTNATKLACQAVNLADASIAYLLEGQYEITPVNIYMANFNAKDQINSYVPTKESDWESLEGQVSQLLEQFHKNGLDVTMDEAKWLFDHDLAINEEMAFGYQQLRWLQENMSIEQVVGGIVHAMASGTKAMDAVLVDGNHMRIESMVKQYQNISDEALESVVMSGSKINLVNLQAAMEKEGSFGSQDQNPRGQQENELQKELNLITARRQLEEIRVRLTYEAGMKLAVKGISIQTEGIDELVTKLKGLETEYYQKLLLEAGSTLEKDSVELLQKTFECKNTIAQAPSYVLGVKFAERTQVTLGSLAELSGNMSDQLRHANEAYEPLMTAPRADMGDRIEKAFANMDSLLEELSVEPSFANKRAVRILSYNQMEITKSSIEQMKEYDLKVHNLIESLKPAATVELIKEGVNPIDLPIDELKERLDQIANDMGDTQEERYSNYLAKIQKTDTLTQEQRESYIGIYRLLNNVEKSDGKAIGYLVNSGREITLNNLLSAVRSIKAEGMDATIDDSFGLLSDITYQSMSIGDQIGAAFSGNTPGESATIAYNNELSNTLYKEATPEFFEYVERTQDLMNCSMEQLYEKYQEYQNLYGITKDTTYESFLTQVQAAMDMTQEMKFLKNYHVDVNVSNIIATNDVLMNSVQFRRSISSHIANSKEVPQTFELESINTHKEFNKKYQNFVNSCEEGLREAFENPTLTVEKMLAINGCLKGTSLLKDLSKKQFYQIPVEVEGRIVEVGLSIQSGSEEKGKLSIKMDSETFGTVNLECKLVDEELRGFVLCEMKPMAGVLEHSLDMMKEKLLTQVKDVQLHIGTQDQAGLSLITSTSEDRQDEDQTETLYQIAKIFIGEVKRMDQIANE